MLSLELRIGPLRTVRRALLHVEHVENHSREARRC